MVILKLKNQYQTPIIMIQLIIMFMIQQVKNSAHYC